MPSLTAWLPAAAPTLLILVVGIPALVYAAMRLARSMARARDPGDQFLDEVVRLAGEGQVDDAIARCAAVRSPMADVALVVLRSRVREEADLRGLAEAARLSVLPALGRGERWLPAVGVGVATLGGAGAVMGIQHAWRAGRPVPAEALDPLALGLLIAAILAFAHGWLATRATRAESRIATLSARLVNALRDRPDVRLGHR